jgi:hypothetical protein
MKKLLDFTSSKKFMAFVSFLGLFLIVTGGSWAYFTYTQKPTVATGDFVATGKSRIDPNLPKTEPCPINGQLYSVPAREFWEDRRPITVSIENHADARPQSGLSFADTVYEVVAEGGITRFLAVFYCGASAQDVRIAPIRSARVYLIDWASEYGKDPIFVHVGGANNICNNCPGGVKPAGDIAREVDAFRMLNNLGWRGAKGNDFDGGTNVGVPVIIRDVMRLGKESAWEHSVVGFTDEIFDEAKARGFGYTDENGVPWNKSFIPWKFTDEKPLSPAKATEISFEFWSNKSDYDVTWKYDSGSNSYLRFNGEAEQVDFETGKQLTAKDVVVQFLKETGPVDKEGHMFYTTTGKGEALIFQNGDVIKGTWSKPTTGLGRTKFYDSSGNEINFVRGTIWIEGVPAGNSVNY